jgi:hypothetical protein
MCGDAPVTSFIIDKEPAEPCIDKRRWTFEEPIPRSTPSFLGTIENGEILVQRRFSVRKLDVVQQIHPSAVHAIRDQECRRTSVGCFVVLHVCLLKGERPK